MEYLLGFLYFAFDAVAILLLVATWQHTRIQGFLVLAASYALGILARWTVPLLYRLMEGGEGPGPWLAHVMQSLWLVIAAVGLYGLWDIYRRLKRAPSSAPSAG